MKYVVYTLITSMVFYGFYKFYFLSSTVCIRDYACYLKDPIFYGALCITVLVDILILHLITKTHQEF
ncbi:MULTISPECIES: hypothetical protein [Myroides]|uniref:Uncharacterized protein n=1 Tax=Myroides albus TaxID=2562892 RepID=A0A6I3LKX7_9FLAO|nr:MULTISPECIES: hypothetical protein [Myroides]MTG96685.1 hypothetical protein [Myroides albus]MVX34697.1 hypothetical protein [Myroides sp. LoEW2-1]UVD80903.1 hypothetical protein NWE55_06570 [Myroides albus]